MEQPTEQMINNILESEDDGIQPELRIGLSPNGETYTALSFTGRDGTLQYQVLMSAGEAASLGMTLISCSHNTSIAQALVNSKETFDEAVEYLREMMPILGLEDVK